MKKNKNNNRTSETLEKKSKRLFHRISYVQYPFQIIAVFYLVKAYYALLMLDDFDVFLGDINKGLLFLGIGICFSTLQDPSKVQNSFSRKIWQSRRKGKVALVTFTAVIVLCLFFGILGLYASGSNTLREMALGLIVLAVGCIGLLKTSVEMYVHHRKS